LFDRVQESFSSTGIAYGDIELVEIVYKLTESVAKRTGYSFSSVTVPCGKDCWSISIPALKRIREGTRIRNPLLGPIRKDYEYLFNLSSVPAVEDVELELEIPDEEIGFLVMHFGASVERLNQLRRRVRSHSGLCQRAQLVAAAGDPADQRTAAD
jgi:mannitol operon transcriptional antiterminator